MTAPGTPIIDIVALADVSVGFLNGQSATWNISYGTTFAAPRLSGPNVIRKGPTSIATGQSRLINIATRGYVDSQKRLVGGFVVSSGQPRKVLVRGVGKTLGVFGVPNATADTVLEVYDSKGIKIFENDDWQKGSGAGELPRETEAPVNAPLDPDHAGLALEIALDEVQRLRARLGQVAPTADETLLAEATQSYVSLLAAASHLDSRAPRVAQQLRYRAERLHRAMPKRRA